MDEITVRSRWLMSTLIVLCIILSHKFPAFAVWVLVYGCWRFMGSQMAFRQRVPSIPKVSGRTIGIDEANSDDENEEDDDVGNIDEACGRKRDAKSNAEGYSTVYNSIEELPMNAEVDWKKHEACEHDGDGLEQQKLIGNTEQLPTCRASCSTTVQSSTNNVAPIEGEGFLDDDKDEDDWFDEWAALYEHAAEPHQ